MGAHDHSSDVCVANLQLGAVVRGEEEARADLAPAETAAKLAVRALPDCLQLADPRRPLWGRQRVGGEVLEGRAVDVAAQLSDEEEAAVGLVRSSRGERGGRGERSGILGEDEGEDCEVESWDEGMHSDEWKKGKRTEKEAKGDR